LDLEKENNINNHIDSDPTAFNDAVGGKNKEWKEILTRLSQKHIKHQIPQYWEDQVKQRYVTNYNNVGELNKPHIDDNKLLYPLHVDRSQYQTHEELYNAIVQWWTNIKGRESSTIKLRIRHARSMSNHSIYPVDWFKFEPEQIINQLIYRQTIEYNELQEKTGNPTYGLHQLRNLWKTVKTFSQSFGIDISHWGWEPPSPPDPQVKIVPRPITVNKLIHNWYSNDRYENALIRTLLTFGFHAGVRPEELIDIRLNDIKLDEGYIIITERKKHSRKRQIWLDDPVLYSKQQNSLKNYLDIWRPRTKPKTTNSFLFIQKNGEPFPSEDAFRMYLAPFVKPIWKDFKPKIMRDWSAIARLIRTKIETKKWDVWHVKNALGHTTVSTTENYIKYAEEYYRKDPFDWLRIVLKFHRNSKRMRRLMKEDYGSSQKPSGILSNAKNRPGLRFPTGEKLYGPTGLGTFQQEGSHSKFSVFIKV